MAKRTVPEKRSPKRRRKRRLRLEQLEDRRLLAGIVAGVKFNDLNANGVRDGGEPGLPGWTMFVDGNSNGLIDGGELSASTSGDGSYVIPGVPAGSQDVVEVPQNGWQASLPASTPGSRVEPNPPILPRSGTASTTVSSDISTNTTWTNVSGPYRVSSTISVNSGVTLTIEPGVEVLFDSGKQLRIDGQLDAIGTAAEPILFTSSAVTPARNDWSGVSVQNTSGAEAHFAFATIEYANTAISTNKAVTIADSVIRHNSTGLSGSPGIRTEVDRTVFDDNTRGVTGADRNIRDSLFANNVDGIGSGVRTDVTNSVFRNNTRGLHGALDLVVRNSEIRDNTTGVEQHFNAGPRLYNNDIHHNDVGAILGAGSSAPIAEFNSFHDNTTLNLQTRGNADKNLKNNHWGTTTNSAIDASIEDARENVSLGLVTYEPILATPPTTVPDEPGRITVNVVDSQTVSNVDFGNYQLATISGVKFDDLDGNATKDAGEPGLEDWTIYVDDNDNGQLDNSEIRVQSGSNGSYSISGLSPGTYRLREVGQPDWTNTLPAAGFVDVVLESGETAGNVDFGNHEPGRPDPVTINGLKFNDLNADGVKDAGEPGLSGWTIFLDANGNRQKDTGELTTVTAADGSYSFPNLPAGTHIVGEIQQTIWQQSFPELLTPVPPEAPATTSIDHSSITATTNVSGGIFEDTTWSLAESPVLVTDTVSIFPAATLTIDPGVVVLFDAGKRIDVRGKLKANGTAAGPILFTSSSATPAKNDWSGISVNNSVGGSAELKFSTFEYASSAISISNNNSLAMDITDSTFRNNTTAISHSSVSKYNVARSLFDNNTTAIRAGDMNVFDSIFSNNTTALAETFRMTIENSLFTGNDTAVRGYSDTTIRHSVISGNTIGVQEAVQFGAARIESSTITENDIGFQTSHTRNLVINGNNIFDNVTFNLDVQTNKDHDLTGNYWGTQSALDIATAIHDSADDPAVGTATVDPYSLQEIDTTPLEVGFHTVTLGSGAIANNIDFGNFQKLDASFAAATAAVNEDAAVVIVEGNLAAPLPFDISVPITFTGTAVLNADFTVSDPNLVFAAGSTTGSMTLTINDDARFEAVDTIIMTIEAGFSAVPGSIPTQTMSITDNDPIPTISFFTAGTTAEESAGQTFVEARITAESEVDIAAPLLLSGTALSGSDYTIAPSPTIMIPAGALRGSIPIDIINDPDGELAERIQIDFGTPVGAVVSTAPGDPSTHVITIPQNDVPNVSFTTSQGSFAENGGTLQVTVRLSNSAPGAVTVPYSISHGANATSGDYNASPAGSITIPMGLTEGVITLTGLNDSTDESNERIALRMGTPTGAVAGSTRSLVATIVDDDRAYVQFSSSGRSVWEGDGAHTVTVQLNRPSTSTVTVSLSRSGTARPTGSSRDYDMSLTALTFSPGQTSKTFTLDPRGDTTTERTEYGYVKLSVSGASRGRRHTYRIAIKDDDPYVYMSRGSNIREYRSTATTISVRLTARSNRTVTVPIRYG